MSYPMITLNGDINPCYLFLKEVKRCFKNNLYPQTDCVKQKQDFSECHNKEKYYKLMAQASEQIRKAHVINVPHYDKQNDRFIFDNGKIVDNNDPIFQKYNWL